MEDICVEDIIDTKVVNNTSYKLVVREENGVKMKLWIPEYFVKYETKSSPNSEIKICVLSPEEKISHLYQQLEKATMEEISDMQKHIIHLGLNELPRSRKPEINLMIAKMMENYKTERKVCQALVKKLRRSILQENLVLKRKEQLSLMFCLQKEINLISRSSKKIIVENFVDMEILPYNFTYINSIVPSADVSFPKNPPMGCDCIGKRICFLNNCCPEKFNSQSTYNEYGQVLISPQSAIYECNKNCKCVKLCSNRIVQRGSNVFLTIFRTKRYGWGVRASELIEKGTFVIEYVGEVIKRDVAIQKSKDEKIRHYLFDLNFNTDDADCPYTIDSSTKGNISRFINHSCNPNLIIYSVWINWSDPNIYHVALFASRDIQPDEEITFNYSNLSQKSDRMISDCKCSFH